MIRNAAIPLLLIANALLASCQQSTEQPKTVSDNTTHEKSATLLRRETVYDKVLDDSVTTITLNSDTIKKLEPAEKAAVGFVASFIGSECDWDGEMRKDRSNLSCKLITALGLGYQCSKIHLGYLRKWFREDSTSLLALNGCPTTPYTATVQNTFDSLSLTTNQDTIIVYYDASGINFRAGEGWHWKGKNYFAVNGDKIALVKKEETEPLREQFNKGEEE